MKIKKYFLMKNIWPRYELIASYFFLKLTTGRLWIVWQAATSCKLINDNKNSILHI